MAGIALDAGVPPSLQLPRLDAPATYLFDRRAPCAVSAASLLLGTLRASRADIACGVVKIDIKIAAWRSVGLAAGLPHQPGIMEMHRER